MTIKKKSLQRVVLHSEVNFPLTLAPMVGLSHTSFRRLLRDYLPSQAETLWPTEMLSSRRLPREKIGETPETRRHKDDCGFLIPQILGNEDEAIQKSVRILEVWGASGIDINMGCPVTKALRHNYGVSLMGDPEYAAHVVKVTVHATRLPVSVKLRAAESGAPEDLLRFAEGLISSGAQWLTLHPRKGSQRRRGSADWSQIRWLRERIQCPLIGNGDIQTHDDIVQMIEETQCDMVMIGRALTARPWLLWQFGESQGFSPPQGKACARAPQGPYEEAKEYGRSLVKLLDYMKEDFQDPSLVHRKFMFYVKTGSVWLDFGQDLNGLVHKNKDLSQLRIELESFFEKDLCLCQRTELRQ